MTQSEKDILKAANAVGGIIGKFYIVANFKRRPTYDTISHGAEPYQKHRQEDQIVNLFLNRDYVLTQTSYRLHHLEFLFMEVERIHFFDTLEEAAMISQIVCSKAKEYMDLFCTRMKIDHPDEPIDYESFEIRVVKAFGTH